MISCVDNDVWHEELCVFYSWHFGNQLSVVSIVPYFVLKPCLKCFSDSTVAGEEQNGLFLQRFIVCLRFKYGSSFSYCVSDRSSKIYGRSQCF